MAKTMARYNDVKGKLALKTHQVELLQTQVEQSAVHQVG